VHFVYSIASYLLFVSVLPALLFHPKLRHGIAARLGLYGRGLAAGSGSPRTARARAICSRSNR
jgi:3-deoxy-D-manno-octulosonic-acid transferase